MPIQRRAVVFAVLLLSVSLAGAQESMISGVPEGGGLGCGTEFYDDGSQESGVTLNAGNPPATDPNFILGVYFELADFGLTPDDFELIEYCTPDDINFGLNGANTLYVHNDNGAGFPEEPALHSAQITVGMAGGTEILPVVPPVPLSGDFWILNRGTAGQDTASYLLGLDTSGLAGQSYFSTTGLGGVIASGLGNYMIRATTQVASFPVIEVPTLGMWGLVTLLAALADAAVVVLQRRA